jgi:hypothetical protein
MKEGVENYYLLLDLHGPDGTYQSLHELLNKLRAEKLDYGFPVWCFVGKVNSHEMYRTQFDSVLPPVSIYQPEVRYCFLLMNSTGYTSYGRYEPAEK